ncbi:MAG: hypothetical protein KF761_09850 [Salinibacterium sp.]|nr:hypothetical protein [Salinibacterium sp.]
MVNILGNIASVPGHWFRIRYAQNALTRSLGVPVESLTPPLAATAMVLFQRDYRPQHAELDELWCTWRPGADSFHFAFERRMHRHDHSPATLSLSFCVALTPTRQGLTGSTLVVTERDATATDGYRAVVRAGLLDSAISFRGGEPLTT